MAKVSGIDFSGMESFKEAVTVKFPDGSDVELPLITLRDAPIATSFLRENDMLATRYAMLTAKSMQKQQALGDATKDMKDDDEVSDTEVNLLADTTDYLISYQRELRGLHAALASLCDSIVEFIKPYYASNPKVIECLKTSESGMVLKVLELMLYGTEALKVAEDGAEDKNPTTTPSQNS